MTEPAPRTAIIVPVELPEALERLRLAGDPMARLGVPAHVTLLFPFMPAAAIFSGVLEDVAVVVAQQAAFDVAFSTVRTFPSTDATIGVAGDDVVLWLAPDPAGPFSALTNRLAGAYPEYPPYGGAHDAVIPHLTIATGDAARSLGREEIRQSLPVRRRVDEAALLVEDRSGRWVLGQRFPLMKVLQLD